MYNNLHYYNEHCRRLSQFGSWTEFIYFDWAQRCRWRLLLEVVKRRFKKHYQHNFHLTSCASCNHHVDKSFPRRADHSLMLSHLVQPPTDVETPQNVQNTLTFTVCAFKFAFSMQHQLSNCFFSSCLWLLFDNLLEAFLLRLSFLVIFSCWGAGCRCWLLLRCNKM